MIEEEDEFRFDFDILDATKIWPEEDCTCKNNWKDDIES